MHLLVLGGGVIGLTTAIRLQESGWQTTIWTAAPPTETTSSIAAAMWYPYKAYPAERVLAWGRRSFEVFAALASAQAGGVRMQEGIELWRALVTAPWWRDAVVHFREAAAEELPAGYACGFVFTVPIVEMPIYLNYLLGRFTAGGGRMDLRTVHAIEEAAAAAPVIVNCTGLGARALIGDTLLAPIRGQIVRVGNPGLHRFVLDDGHPEGMAYIIPRAHDCILGGTAEDGLWDQTPDPGVSDAIIRRCTALEPRLADAPVLEHRVGLRPGRPAVRLDQERLSNGAICIHNYGHGGGGVTLSWGCADEVARMLSA